MGETGNRRRRNEERFFSPIPRFLGSVSLIRWAPDTELTIGSHDEATGPCLYALVLKELLDAVRQRLTTWITESDEQKSVMRAGHVAAGIGEIEVLRH